MYVMVGLDRGVYHVTCHNGSGRFDDGLISENALDWGSVGS